MKIEQNNYEAYLLLYVDNELSEADALAVETFVQQHPEAAVELELLFKAKLQPEEKITFNNKEGLLQIARGRINRENFQEQSLLYIDNELSSEKKQAVETFVLQHPDLQEEFLLYKQTVLQHERIVFKEKHLLYRAKANRIVSVNWKPLSIAAAVLLIIGWAWMQYSGTRIVDKNQTIAKTQPQIPTNVTNKLLIKSAPHKIDKQLNGTVTIKNIIPAPKTYDIKNIAKNVNRKQKSEVQNTSVYPESVAKTDAITTHLEIIKERSVELIKPSLTAYQNTQTENSYISTVPITYTELNTGETDQNFYLGSLEIGKDKVKGLFRKATRLFANKLKTEENENLQVAVFEINTK